jgi:heterodisulfide reductase subunit A-like polyferredoxin
MAIVVPAISLILATGGGAAGSWFAAKTANAGAIEQLKFAQDADLQKRRQEAYSKFMATAQSAYKAKVPDDSAVRSAETLVAFIASAEVTEAAGRLADYVLAVGQKSDNFDALVSKFTDAVARESRA